MRRVGVVMQRGKLEWCLIPLCAQYGVGTSMSLNLLLLMRPFIQVQCLHPINGSMYPHSPLSFACVVSGTSTAIPAQPSPPCDIDCNMLTG